MFIVKRSLNIQKVQSKIINLFSIFHRLKKLKLISQNKNVKICGTFMYFTLIFTFHLTCSTVQHQSQIFSLKIKKEAWFRTDFDGLFTLMNMKIFKFNATLIRFYFAQKLIILCQNCPLNFQVCVSELCKESLFYLFI